MQGTVLRACIHAPALLHGGGRGQAPSAGAVAVVSPARGFSCTSLKYEHFRRQGTRQGGRAAPAIQFLPLTWGEGMRGPTWGLCRGCRGVIIMCLTTTPCTYKLLCLLQSPLMNAGCLLPNNAPVPGEAGSCVWPFVRFGPLRAVVSPPLTPPRPALPSRRSAFTSQHLPKVLMKRRRRERRRKENKQTTMKTF